MPEAQRVLHCYLAALALSLCGVTAPAADGKNETATPGKTRKGPEDSGKNAPAAPAGTAAGTAARKIILPKPGSYRAPGILRLAGKLHGLPVKVEQRELNDETIRISKQLGEKPVTLNELNLMLASQSFYLHVWDHPRHGKLLVVSRRQDWKPENLRFKKILTVGPRGFNHAWVAVQNTKEALNADLEPGSPRIVTLASVKAGKIFIWAPRKDWLQKVTMEAEKSISEALNSRQRLSSYKALHLRASRLKEALLEKFPEEELERIHITVAPWGNHLLYRANQEYSARLLELLKKLDKPPEKVR